MFLQLFVLEYLPLMFWCVASILILRIVVTIVIPMRGLGMVSLSSVIVGIPICDLSRDLFCYWVFDSLICCLSYLLIC